MNYLIAWLQNWGLREAIGLVTSVGFLGALAIIVHGTQVANQRLNKQSRSRR